MSTSGHLVTMLGVVAFYFMILDSKIEKKTQINISTLIARVNRRTNYYLIKILTLYINKVKYANVPHKNIQLLLSA